MANEFNTPDSPDAALIAALRLSLVPGIGPLTRQALIEHFGSAENVLAATGQQLQAVSGVGAKLSGAIKDADEIDVETELAICREHQIDLIAASDARYPRMLSEIHDPPAIFYCRGELQPQEGVAIGIVVWPAQFVRLSAVWPAALMPPHIAGRWTPAGGRSLCWPAGCWRFIRRSTRSWPSKSPPRGHSSPKPRRAANRWRECFPREIVSSAA